MFPGLTEHEKDQLLEFFKNYLQPDLRRELMRELPRAYNHWLRDTYVLTVHADTREEV